MRFTASEMYKKNVRIIDQAGSPGRETKMSRKEKI